MAYSVHTNFTIYNEEVQTGFNETLVQETDAFNAASNGAIVMQTNLHEGYFSREAFFKAIADGTIISRRDLTGTSTTADTALTQDEFIGVKLHRKIGPIATSRGAMRSIMRDPGEFSVLIGQQAAKGTAVNMLNDALTGAVAALGGQSSVVHNVTAASPTDTISTDNLIQTLGKAGDSAGDIALWVMHSTAYYKLVRDQVSSHSFDAVAGVNIATGTAVTLGRPVLITDSSALFGNTSPTDPVRVLGLRRGGLMVENSELEDMVVDDVTGYDQLAIRVQGELAYTLKIMGFKWDVTTAGANAINPTGTVLATGSNWDLAATSYKSLAGVMMIADPS